MTLAVAAFLFAPQLVRLSNGIPVILEKGAGTTVAIEIQFDIATATSAERSALEVVAGAMLGETENMSLRAMQRLAWQIGGSVDSDLAGDVLRLQIVTAKTHLQPALTFLSETVRKPAFSSESMKRAHSAVDRRLRHTAASPLTAAFRRAGETIGTQPSGALTVNKRLAEQFHSFFVHPARMTMAVVGDIDVDATSRAVSGAFGNWQSREVKRPSTQKASANPKPIGFTLVSAIVPGPKPGDPEFAAWMTLVTAIGKGKGSLLNIELRENSGWSYVNDVQYQFATNKSYAVLSAVHSGESGEGEKLLKSALARTDYDIDRAKGYAKGLFVAGKPTLRLLPFAQGQVTNTERAFALAWWQRRGSIAALDAFQSALDAVTEAEVKAAAAKWLPQATFITE